MLTFPLCFDTRSDGDMNTTSMFRSTPQTTCAHFCFQQQFVNRCISHRLRYDSERCEMASTHSAQEQIRIFFLASIALCVDAISRSPLSYLNRCRNASIHTFVRQISVRSWSAGGLKRQVLGGSLGETLGGSSRCPSGVPVPRVPSGGPYLSGSPWGVSRAQ